MKIAHFQKFSLQDFPGKISCIIFVAGCNFRCKACYNAFILDLNDFKETPIEEKEIFDFLESRKGKLEGVVISGGEPLIHNDIIEFIEKIRAMGFLVKLDTNGSNPELLKKIVDKKIVDYVAIDIKARKEDYEKVVGTRIDLERIENSMRILEKSEIDHEFRTTLCPVVDGENIREMKPEDIGEIAKWISSVNKKAKLYLQPFLPIEGRLVEQRLEKMKRTRGELLKESQDEAKKFLENVFVRD